MAALVDEYIAQSTSGQGRRRLPHQALLTPGVPPH